MYLQKGNKKKNLNWIRTKMSGIHNTDFKFPPSSPHPLVGFTGGQIHLIDPVHKELSRLYNEERLLDKTKVGE